MSDGKAEERKATERQQFELAERLFKDLSEHGVWIAGLPLPLRHLLFEELKSHQSLHVAQGNEPEAAHMLELLRRVAEPDPQLRYRATRLSIAEFERRGLGGRALAVMGELYEKYRYKRAERVRSAEVVMEYGILHDRYGDKEEACNLFKHSIGRYERLDHQYNLAAAWFNTASVLYDLNKIKASINACEKGLGLGGAQHLDLKTHLLLQRANCRERTQEFALAVEDYLDAANGYDKLGRRRQQCNILFRVGWLLGKQKRMLEARNLLYKALKISKELDYSAGLARFHLRRAQFLLEHQYPAKIQQHLQHSIMYARLARADKIEKIARGALYRALLEKRRPLTFYMKARAPEANAAALAKAGQGSYSHRVSDGYAIRVWRDAPRSAGKDVTFLARLLAELGRRAQDPEFLLQSSAVTNWQRSVRQGRRTH
ncbi:MAG: hypothetical protein WC314_14200 [Vulcanimicrobiota bacterium]